eukprot:g3057.t1
MGRVAELHLEHQQRSQKRALQLEAARKQEDDRVNQEIEQGRQRARMNKDTQQLSVIFGGSCTLTQDPAQLSFRETRQDKNRKLSPKTKAPWHVRLTEPKVKPEDPTAKAPSEPKPVQRATGADFILDALLSALRLRCFACEPPDKEKESGKQLTLDMPKRRRVWRLEVAAVSQTGLEPQLLGP